MATQSTHPSVSQQYPAHQKAQFHQQPQGYNIDFRGNSYGSGSLNIPAAAVEPYLRIAVLEKELEHCQTGKAEAEIALQYLVKVNAKATPNSGNRDEEIAELKQHLAQARKEKEASEAKLEYAWAIIATVVVPKSSTPALKSASNSNGPQHGPASIHREDLIDLADTRKGFGSLSSSENNTTLHDQSNDEISEDGIDGQHQGYNKLQLAPKLNDYEDGPYIHHFLDNGNDAPIRRDAGFKTLSQIPSLESRVLTGSKSFTSSPDQRSESSVEPDTDGSSHKYTGSSAGPASTSTSFVTADTTVYEAQDAPAETAAEEVATAHALGVQRWNMAASTSAFENVEAAASAVPFIEMVRSRKNCNKPQFVAPSYGPASVGPSWSSYRPSPYKRQRDESTAIHQTQSAPNGRKFLPNLSHFGVRFKPTHSEHNVFRMILVRGISPDTTMHQLLDNVHGGKVVDAKLLDTCKFLDTNSALVIFLDEHAAKAYVESAKTNPLTINNCRVHVKLVDTPTYPMRTGLKKAIDDLHHTRCLEVKDLPDGVSMSQLRLDLRVSGEMHGDRIEHLRMRKDGILELRFSSIEYAGQGFDTLTTDKNYKGCKARFAPDPCGQPLGSLHQKGRFDTINTPEQTGCQSLEAIGEDYDEASSVVIKIHLESADERSVRLQKSDWETEAEDHRGRGLETKVESVLDAVAREAAPA